MKKSLLSVLVTIGMLGSGALWASEDLAKSKGCLACHAVDQKRVGPSFKQVAEKYAGQADAEAQLAQRVMNGGSGVWGTVPMPPNPAVSQDEAKTLVRWILDLK